MNQPKVYVKGSRVVLICACILLCWITFGALTRENLLSGESSILSNVVIDFVREGKWHYPVHAQSTLYPAVKKFMIHPPLHYILSSGWVKLFGIGVWQLKLQSVVSFLGCVLIVTAVAAKIYGKLTATMIPILAVASSAFIYSAFELRPDMTFGLTYCLTVILLGMIHFSTNDGKIKYLICFLFGFLTVTSLAAHWFGYFVQLYFAYFCLLVLWRQKTRGAVVLMWGLLGWATALAIWWVSFEDDLIRSMIFVLIKGNDFRTSIGSSVTNALVFLTDWNGGWWLIAGMGLCKLHAVLLIIKKLKGKSLPLADQVTLYLCANILVYVVFFYYFVGNKSPQYASNILWLCYLLASIGYVKIVRMLFKSWRLNKLTPWVMVLVSILAIFRSEVIHYYLVSDPLRFNQTSKNYQDVRNGLAKYIPQGASVVVGGNAYPYLYDRNHTSTLKLVIENALVDPGPMSLMEAIKHYRGMTRSQYIEAPFPIANRLSSLKQADYLVVPDNGHSWQNLFFDRSVWKNDYKEIVNLAILPIIKPAGGIFAYKYPKYFRVLARNGISLPALTSDEARIFSLGENVLLIAHGSINRHEFATGVDWLMLDNGSKISKVIEYLNMLNWYGAKLDLKEQQEICNQLIPHINQYIARFRGNMINQVPVTRTFADAVDYGLDMLGYPLMFPRIALDDQFHESRNIP
jgi:hypothetical protein